MKPVQLILINNMCNTNEYHTLHNKDINWYIFNKSNVKKRSGFQGKAQGFMRFLSTPTRVGVKYSTCTWYLYLSTNLSVLDVLEYLVYGNVKVLVLVLDQKVLGTYK